MHHCAHTLLFLLPIDDAVHGHRESFYLFVCAGLHCRASERPLRYAKNSAGRKLIVRAVYARTCSQAYFLQSNEGSATIEGWKDQCVRAAVDLAPKS